MGHTHQAPFAQTNEALINEVLGEYGDLTRQRLQAFLPQEEPKSYLYELLADYPLRGGKMLRSSLCIAMARATGAPIEDAIASAVSIELMHNALLVHDDIEDASDERRGTPTLHALHGVPLALNAGDAMGLLSLRPLKDKLSSARARDRPAHLRGDRAHGLGERRRPGARTGIGSATTAPM